MADLLRVRTAIDPTTKVLSLAYADEEMGTGYSLMLDQPLSPDIVVKDGDVWQVKVVSTKKGKHLNDKGIARVRFIAKERERQKWESITSLPNFWIEPENLYAILAWLHAGTDLILVGDKGCGKTTLPYALAECLGWQQPCKVDTGTLKNGLLLFGSNAAPDGRTVFIRSNLLDYIERAIYAYEAGLDTQFIILLDEINAIHAKIGGALHGLFDDTRQVSLTTAEGTKVVKLPPNIHTIGTMNMGAGYTHTHVLSEALMDRFMPVRIQQMPEDVEVARLTKEVGIEERKARQIVVVARRLRATPGLSYSPSYRVCRSAAQLVKAGLSVRQAIERSFFGWYEGDFQTSSRGEKTADPNTELARALAVLRSQSV